MARQSVTVRRELIEELGEEGAALLAPRLSDTDVRRLARILTALGEGPDEQIGPDPAMVADFRTLMFGGAR